MNVERWAIAHLGDDNEIIIVDFAWTKEGALREARQYASPLVFQVFWEE
jgi:hypothetical protein